MKGNDKKERRQAVEVLIGGSTQPGSEESLTGLSGGLLSLLEAPRWKAQILVSLPSCVGLNLPKRALN